MAYKTYLVAFAAACCWFATGINATKCTHCAYINDGQCEKVVCEGDWCNIVVYTDIRLGSTLVHKSCGSFNGGNAAEAAGCKNGTKAGIQNLACSCNSDFCTDSVGGDIDFVNQLWLAQNSIPLGAFTDTANNESAIGTDRIAPGSEPQSTTPVEGTTPEAPTGTPFLGSNATEGTPTPAALLPEGSQTTPAPGTETTPGSNITSINSTIQIFWGVPESSTPSGNASGTEGTGGLEVNATTAVPLELVNMGGSPEVTTPNLGSTEAGPLSNASETTPSPFVPFFNETAAPESTPGASPAGLFGETTPLAIGTENATGSPTPGGEGNATTPSSAPQSNANISLADLETVVNERVNFFSAVSLQRLPPNLATNVLTPDKQHYDVLTSRLDADMSFNPVQLDDIVESERIYLPPKPMHESESGGPDPFNGVLIGRDLEQVNAWPQLQPIPFAFRPSVDNDTREVVRHALALWQNNTCVSFFEAPAVEQFILEIDSQPSPADVIACGAATVGRWPQVKLQIWKAGPEEKGCVLVGTIAHELGHILGLWHAQSRFDAYEFVYVPADTNGNVDVHPQAASQSNYDVGYDYGSIMHFAEDALHPKDPRFSQTTGQRRAPSFIDYKTVNLQQRCVDLCPTALNCYVGGYATPPDCSKCHCPSGFGGDRCETVQPSVGDCGPNVGSDFATDDWKEITVNFPGGKGPEGESKCFWHLWGKNGSQVELQVVNVSFRAAASCVDVKTGERNFIEIKVGDNDADKSFDFQRTGFRLCTMDPLEDATERPIVSTNRLIVLAAYAGSPGSFTVRYRNAGGGNPGLAAALHASGLATPVRPGVRVSATVNSTAALLFEAGEEVSLGQQAESQEERCDVRRSLVPGDRLASPCRVLRSFYGRYTYVFTRRGRHRIYFNERYFEPKILIYDARLTPVLNNSVLINDKNDGLQIEDAATGAKFEPFPYYLSSDRQKALGPLKLVVTEDGRLAVRSLNGTEITVVCLAHFSCVRLHRRLQSMHLTSNDTRVMLQGGILYSDNRLFFATLSNRGELAIWQRGKATDPLSTSSSKMIWAVGPWPKDRAGQPYRLFIERDGTPSIRDGDDDIVWKVNSTIAKNQFPTTLSLSDQGKLTLDDATGKQLWTNQ